MSDSLHSHGLYSHWNSLGQNTGVGSPSLLQVIFPTQGSNLGLLHCRRILFQLSYQEMVSMSGNGTYNLHTHFIVSCWKKICYFSGQQIGYGQLPLTECVPWGWAPSSVSVDVFPWALLMSPILQMRKLRLGKVQWLTQVNSAGRGGTEVSVPLPWRRKWHPTPVFLPGKSHGQRSLGSYSPWSQKESDMKQKLYQ